MIFGLFELLVLVGIGWVVVNIVKRATESKRLDPPGPPAQRSETIEVRSRSGDERGDQPAPAQTQQPSPGAQREHKMAELRRRFVADEISVEEYEHELDKLIRNQ